MTRAADDATYADWLWLLAWALASSAWCITAAARLGATFDEPVYLARGLDLWRTGSHGGLIKLGTMPLPIDVCTLPLGLWERWRGVQLDAAADVVRALPWARAGTLVFWWVLLVYGWGAGRQLAGRWGGRLAVAWLACEPNLLAHASLATTDLALAACLLALLYHFRTAREAASSARFGAPLFWGVATILSKASGVFYAPLCLLAVELERVGLRDALRQRAALRRDIGRLLGWALLVVFLYCGSDWRTEPSFVEWAQHLPDSVTGDLMRPIAEHLRIFPNAGEALVRQIRHGIRGHGYGAYLLGTVRPTFWYYFPVALGIKLTLPLLAMPLLLLLLAPRALVNWANAAAAALLAFSLTSRVQIGIRFVLPLIALAVVGLAASLVQAQQRATAAWMRRLGVMAAAGSIVWSTTAAVHAWPDALRYTNELCGGSERGYRCLSDSNYDWGQGLPELGQWQQAHAAAPLDVWYFGSDPRLTALPMRLVRLHALPIAGAADVLEQVRGRYLAVSTTLLYGTLMSPAHRIAAEFLRARAPIARTTTFFIYDFTHTS